MIKMDYTQFYTVLEKWHHIPYNWDTANCCQFASEVVQCWGVDIDIPKFNNTEEAAIWIREQGVKSMYSYLVMLFGKPVAPLQAKRGFVVYRKGQGLNGTAIGAIERKALFVGETGLIELSLGDCACAFNPSKYRGEGS